MLSWRWTKLEVGKRENGEHLGAAGNAFLTKPSLGESDRGSRKKGTKDRPGFLERGGKPENRGESEDATDGLAPMGWGFLVVRTGIT